LVTPTATVAVNFAATAAATAVAVRRESPELMPSA
jgi:hypothetical protein